MFLLLLLLLLEKQCDSSHRYNYWGWKYFITKIMGEYSSLCIRFFFTSSAKLFFLTKNFSTYLENFYAKVSLADILIHCNCLSSGLFVFSLYLCMPFFRCGICDIEASLCFTNISNVYILILVAPYLYMYMECAIQYTPNDSYGIWCVYGLLLVSKFSQVDRCDFVVVRKNVETFFM